METVEEDSLFLRSYFQAHDGDVRSLSSAVIPDGGIITGSRDTTVKVWKPEENSRGFIETACLVGPTHFVSSVCTLPPSTEHPNGLVLVGSNDCAIYGFSLESYHVIFKLLGHSGTVASLATGNFGTIISGSWDKTAKVWVGQSLVRTLFGHQEAVWAVATFPDQGLMLTGSADKTIRLWRSGNTEKVFYGHTDCVRGLAVVSRGEFLSCSNDCSIRLWQTSGNCLGVFTGHSNYVYGIAVLNEKGDFVSCSEDCTLKIWKSGECTISKQVPSSCLWSVSCLANGDVAVGGSNGSVYVFTQHSHLKASDEEVAEYEAAIIRLAEMTKKPTEEMSIDDDLPGVAEALLNPGLINGQQIFCKDGGVVVTYEWDADKRAWRNSSDVNDIRPVRGLMFEGEEYDQIFSIDVEGLMLKLPIRNSDNPWVAAQKFIDKHNLNSAYMDEIVNHIVSNTNQDLSQTSWTHYSDPFTGSDRYVPNSAGLGSMNGHDASHVSLPSNNQNELEQVKFFPKKEYVGFYAGNPDGMKKKLQEFALNVPMEHKLTEKEIYEMLLPLIDGPKEVTSEQMETLQKILYWPEEFLFPCLDLFRLAIKSEMVVKKVSEAGESTITKYLLKQLNSHSPRNNVMLTLRIFCNLFVHDFGAKLLFSNIETICNEAFACAPTDHKQIEIALVTLYLNYAVGCNTSFTNMNSMVVTEYAVKVFSIIKDHEAKFRLMVCLGSLMDDVAAAKYIKSSDIKEQLKIYLAQGELPPKAEECAKQLLNHIG